jgi:hypothetical protein
MWLRSIALNCGRIAGSIDESIACILGGGDLARKTPRGACQKLEQSDIRLIRVHGNP